MTVADDPAGDRPSLPEVDALEVPLTRWLALLKARQAEVQPLLDTLKVSTPRADQDLAVMEAARLRLAESLGTAAQGWLRLDAEHPEVLADLTASVLAAVQRVEAGIEPADRDEVEQLGGLLLRLVDSAQTGHRLLDRIERSLADVLAEDAWAEQRSVIVAARERRQDELTVLAGWRRQLEALIERPAAVVRAAADHELLLRRLDDADDALTRWMLSSQEASAAFQAFSALVVDATMDALGDDGQIDGVLLWQRLDKDLAPLAAGMQRASNRSMTTVLALDAALRALVDLARSQELVGADRAEVRGVLQGVLQLSDEPFQSEAGLTDELIAQAVARRPDRAPVAADLAEGFRAFAGQAVVLQGWRPLVEESGLLAD